MSLNEPVRTRRRDPETSRRARQLRHGDNMVEAVLWNELKASKPGGHKFVRQMPIGPYFADSVCRSAKLVIEMDGSRHADSGYDRQRAAFMRAAGYSILRFWSHDALKHMPSVCETILAAVEGRLAEDAISADLRFVEAGGRASS